MTVTEGNTGTVDATFTVTLSAASHPAGDGRTTPPPTVTATAGSDYQAASAAR